MNELHFNVELDDDENMFENLLENPYVNNQIDNKSIVGRHRRMLNCERDFLL